MGLFGNKRKTVSQLEAEDWGEGYDELTYKNAYLKKRLRREGNPDKPSKKQKRRKKKSPDLFEAAKKAVTYGNVPRTQPIVEDKATRARRYKYGKKLDDLFM
jgi:hypothetical protein